MVDENLRELWRVKDALAREFNYDVEALAAYLKGRKRRTDSRVVNLSAERRRENVPSPSTT